MSPEIRAKISIALMGHKQSLETRAKISAAHMGMSHVPSTETRMKLSAAILGLKRSPETREKMSVARKKRPSYFATPETRIKMSISRWRGGKQVSHRKGKAKRRALGFIPMNKPFDGCEAHHLDKTNVLYIPKVLHRSASHNVFTGKNMERINTLATGWLTEDWT